MTLYKIISSEYCSLIVWIFLQLKINKQRSNSSSHYSLIGKIKHHRTRHTHLEQMPFHSSEAEYICWFILLVTFDILCPLHVSIAHIKCTCTLNILLLKISNFGSLKQQDYDPNDPFRLFGYACNWMFESRHDGRSNEHSVLGIQESSNIHIWTFTKGKSPATKQNVCMLYEFLKKLLYKYLTVNPFKFIINDRLYCKWEFQSEETSLDFPSWGQKCWSHAHHQPNHENNICTCLLERISLMSRSFRVDLIGLRVMPCSISSTFLVSMAV